MKKQPTISPISRKMPSTLFYEILNKLQKKIRNFKDKFLQKIDSQNFPPEKYNLENYISDFDETVSFELGGMGFDQYGNVVKRQILLQ